MKRKLIIQNMKIFGVLMFIILSSLELINLTIISFTEIKIESNSTLLITTLFNLANVDIFLSVAWIFLISFIITFIIFAIIVFKLISDENIGDYLLAKYLFLMGVVILLFSLIKLEYIVLIEASYIDIGGVVLKFEELLQSYSYFPVYTFLMWLLLLFNSCYSITTGLVTGGVNLAWMLKIEKGEQEEIVKTQMK